MKTISILQAVKTLARVCDGAKEQDGVGFCAADVFMRKYAIFDELTVAEENDFYKKLKKYTKTQLAGCEIEKPRDFAIETDEQRQIMYAKRTKTYAKKISKSAELVNGRVKLTFPYNATLINAIKELSNAKKFDWTDKCWYVELDNTQALRDFFEDFDFFVPVDLDNTLKTAIVVNNKTMKLVGDDVEIRFPFNREIVNAVKIAPKRRWSFEKDCWIVKLSIESAEILKSISEQYDFLVEEAIGQHLMNMVAEAEQNKKRFEANSQLSRAMDSTFAVDGLNMPLRPFQLAGVEYAVRNKNVIIGDEMGLGKTVQAISSVLHMNAFPCLIVCPNSLKPNWRVEWKKWTSLDVYVYDPSKKWSCDSKITVVNYDNVEKLYEILKSQNYKSIVMDESQMLKNKKAKRTRAVASLAKEIDMKIMLTGTVVVNRPVELISQLEILGLFEKMFEGWFPFVKRYCGAYRDRFGFRTDGATNLAELHEKLRSHCYIRRDKTQVLTELPPKQWSDVPLEMDKASIEEYKIAERDIINYLRSNADIAIKVAEELSDLQSNGASEEEIESFKQGYREQKAAQASAAEHLVSIEVLKKIAARGKMKAAIEWIESFLESGQKLVLFATHREIVRGISDHFGCNYIDGSVKPEDRQAIVERFQNNADSKLIVLNTKAGGVGLTLTAASNVAFLEFPWTPADMDQAADRCHRIGQKDAVTAWNLYAVDTIDIDILSLINDKRSVVDAVNKGGEVVENKSIMKELINLLTNK